MAIGSTGNSLTELQSFWVNFISRKFYPTQNLYELASFDIKIINLASEKPWVFTVT